MPRLGWIIRPLRGYNNRRGNPKMMEQGKAMSMSTQRAAICIIHPNKSAYSETFIHNHIRHLSAETLALWGTAALHLQNDADRPLVPMAFRAAAGVWAGLQQRFAARGPLPGPNLDRLTARMLARLLARRRIAAVLAEYGQTGVRVMPACRRAGVPLIVHFHGADAHSRSVLDQYEEHYPALFAAAGALVAVSRTMQQQLCNLGAPPEKVHYNPYGVDTEQFRPTRPEQNRPIFLAVGRFVDKKAPHLTLLAFKRVLEACPEARLVMVGDGRLQEPCRQLVQALGMAAAVELVGPLAQSAVADLLRQARCFVQHSVTTALGDMEGTPVAMLEAGASGLPVVSTRHAGISDVVVHHETGFLADEYDVAGMARHMLTLAREPALAASMGRRGRQRIEKLFGLQQSIDNLWAIIASCMQANHARTEMH